MKTDYFALGETSLRRLRETTKNAYRIQDELLAGLLERNRDTEYGRKYDFAHIASMEEYREKVPVTQYKDYDGYVERMLEGESSLLTKAPAVFYSISSGSTGTPKYVPVTDADMVMHYWYAYGAVFGMVREYYQELSPEQIFGKIFQTGEFARTYTSRGVMNGIRSSSLYQWMDQDHDFDASDYCVPKEVLFPEELEDLTYVKVRFALAEPEISAIHGVFIHRVVGLFGYIEEHWELLLKDMEEGTVDESIPLSSAWREKIKRWLPPNKERAGELWKIPREHLRDGMIPKIWKDIKYILTIGGGGFASYMGTLKKYAGEVPIHYFAYAASEGILGVARELNCPDRYILLPESGIFEFIPEREPSASPLSMKEVEAGKKYALIFTNQSGLYRYELMDVVEVVEFYGQAPVIRFCYRKNQVISIADEKTNTEQFEKAIGLFGNVAEAEIAGYGVQADYSVQPGRYLIYIESMPSNVRDASRIMDECLQKCILGYAGCRKMNEIASACVAFLHRGSFGRYEEHLAATGHLMGQNKPLRILDSVEKCDFFAGEMKRAGEDQESREK